MTIDTSEKSLEAPASGAVLIAWADDGGTVHPLPSDHSDPGSDSMWTSGRAELLHAIAQWRGDAGVPAVPADDE